MAVPKSLSVVRPNDAPSLPEVPASVTAAVESGTVRDQFVAMRARIARAIDDPNIRGADLAALSRRLHELTKDIEALDVVGRQEAGQDGPVSDDAFDSAAI